MGRHREDAGEVKGGNMKTMGHPSRASGVRRALAAALAAGMCILANAAFADDTTLGPNGEQPTPGLDLKVSDAGIEKLKAGNYTAALMWHVNVDQMNAIGLGATDELAKYGIKVVATTDDQMDTATQKNNFETVMAKSPSLILTVPFDPVAAAETFRPAADKGVKIVYLSDTAKGWQAGKDFVTLVSADLNALGENAADILAKALGGKGKIGYVYFAPKLRTPNVRDAAFKKTIETKYPGIEIVAEQGLDDPQKAEDIANAFLLKNPDLDGVYAPWAAPAEALLAALRNAGNTHTKIVTIDLSEPLALDMVTDGNVAGLSIDQAYNYGVISARVGAMALAGEPVPPYVTVPTLAVTKDNVKDAYINAYKMQPPASVVKALDGS
jgi:ribose transport system substrate-binding protein